MNFDPKSLDRLDYLIYCLRQQGIYIYLDQLTYRKFKPGDGPEEIVFSSKQNPEQIPALLLVAEKHKVGMVLPGQTDNADMTISPDKSAVDQSENQVISDTAQLCRNWTKRIGWIDTPRTKAVYGFLGDEGA